MEFGAFSSLLPKLGSLLHGEYKLQKGVRKNIEFLEKELETTQAALCSVSEVPPEELPTMIKIWARDAREVSYDMEDTVDTFLVRIQGPDPPSKRSTKRFVRKLFTLHKRHQIGEQIKDIKKRVVELAARRERYMVHRINPVATTLDPRIATLYSEATELVGINNAKQALLIKLQQQRIVSIVGFGGLGKTTLAKAVSDDTKSYFRCKALVSVSRNPDMRKFLKDMLYELDMKQFENIHKRLLDEKQLIDIARQFLLDKRYLIIIDDIWNTSHWDSVIKYALPNNNMGSRIIVTTRNVAVANHIGHTYHMDPLSPYSSRVLLYRRIFGTEDPRNCLDKDLAEVSDRILKKCDGVPLAIITIASLLANKGRSKTEWDEVCNSIGNGMEKTRDAENMRKILSYSYYDMPPYLRTCLLYLSMFPEDSLIKRDRLIRLWMAEDFIQHQRNKSLFEIGEIYFNELINRSMIQPWYGDYGIESCRVHDMVFDLIHSISSEENFITILCNVDQKSPSTMIRRLTLQNDKTDCAMTQATQNMPRLRSIVVFRSALDQMLAIQNFKVLRVLDLQGCDLSNGYNMKYLGSLFHLRYLNLRSTKIDQLPDAVRNLQFLETLDIMYNQFSELPKCVAQLTHLLFLLVHTVTGVFNGIGNLTSLEELKLLRIDDESEHTIQELGLLTELRELHIELCSTKWTSKLVESLFKLRKIQRLKIDNEFFEKECLLGVFDAWVPSQQIRELDIWAFCWLSVLPAWFKNPTPFHNLFNLSFWVRELQQEDLDILGRLPALHYLELKVGHEDLEIFRRFAVGDGLFPCLEHCHFSGFLWPVMFQQGAMPRVTRLEFHLYVPEAWEITVCDGVFDCGLGKLRSLETINVWFIFCSDEELEEAKAKVLHAARMHPNDPHVSFW